MVGGQTGGVVLTHEPGELAEGLGYTHEQVRKSIKKKYRGSDWRYRGIKKDYIKGKVIIREEPVPPGVPEPVVEKKDVKITDRDLIVITWQDAEGNIQRQQVRAYRLRENSAYPFLTPDKHIIRMETKQGKVFYKAQTREEYKQYVKEYEVQQYKEKGVIPSWFKEQVDRPEELKTAISEKGYEQIIWRYHIGEITEHQATELLEHKARHSKEYMQKYATYTIGEKELTFKELKEEEPAIYLEHHINLGYRPKLDVSRWKGEQWKELGKIETPLDWISKVVTGVTPEQAMSAYSVAYLKGFADPGFWYSTAIGEGSTYLYEQEYQMYKRVRKQDYLGVAWHDIILSPPMTNIVYPYAGGKFFGHSFRYISAIGKKVSGTITGKVLSSFATRGPWVAGATISGVIGADIGYTAATTEGGFLSPETMRKIGTYGMQFTIAYAGYRSAMRYKPVTGVKTDGETLYFQKHVTTFRGKPIIPYGEKIYVSRYGTGFIRGPMPPGYRSHRFLTIREFMKTPQQFGTTITRTQTMPYKPPGLDVYHSMQYGYRGAIGEPMVYSTQWGKQMFVETGQEWQPKTPYEPHPYELSTKVFPKPKIYRAYETHFIMFYGMKPLFTITPKIIDMKPFKPIHKKTSDIIKTDTEISKGYTTIDKRGTVQILKPPKVEQIQEQEKILEVPEQLKKPIYKTKKETLEDIRMFKGLKTEYDTQQKTMQKQAQAMVIGSLFEYDRRYLFDTATRLDFRRDIQYKQEFEKIRKQAQTQIQGFGFGIAYVPGYTFETPTLKTKVHTWIPITQPLFTMEKPQVETTKHKVKRFPDIDLEEGKLIIKDAQGFHVYAKDRVYVKGKKVYQDRYVKLSDQPLTRIDALSLGASAIDNSASATFEIRRTTGKPKPLPFSVTPWNMLSHMFYKKDNKYIEKTDYRINTPGEIQGISALGWISEKKKTSQPIKLFTDRKTRRKQKPIDIMSMQDFMDIDKQMQQIMKRSKHHGF